MAGSLQSLNESTESLRVPTAAHMLGLMQTGTNNAAVHLLVVRDNRCSWTQSLLPGITPQVAMRLEVLPAIQHDY